MVPWAHMSPQSNGISIGSSVFAVIMTVTDRPTDIYEPHYSVTTGRI